MATNIIQGIQTSTGTAKYDYNSLANLPQSDSTLTISGGFADGFIVGQNMANLLSKINDLEKRVKALESK